MIPLHAPEWVEGWAMDNYFESDMQTFTPLAHLIRHHKYGKQENAKELSRMLGAFIDTVWPSLPFDVVVPVTGQLTNEIAKHLDLPEFLLTKLDTTKVKFTPHEGRERSLNNFMSDAVEAKKGILVVDDIFDSGFSMRGACRALAKYSLPIYVVALTINNYTK